MPRTSRTFYTSLKQLLKFCKFINDRLMTKKTFHKCLPYTKLSRRTVFDEKFRNVLKRVSHFPWLPLFKNYSVFLFYIWLYQFYNKRLLCLRQRIRFNPTIILITSRACRVPMTPGTAY